MSHAQTRPTPPHPLSPDLLRKMHACWRAANYLSPGQIYLQDNALLEVPLTLAHVKPRLLAWARECCVNTTLCCK